MRKMYVVLAVILMFAAIAPAQGIGLHAIAPKVGVVFPQDWDMGFLFGAKANLGEISEDLELHPFALYWTAGSDEFGIDLSLSNIQIGGDVVYFLPNVEGLYVGGGLSINFLSFEAGATFFNPFTGQTESITADESLTRIGISPVAGYEIPVGDNWAFVEVRYNIISDFNAFEIEVGYFFDLSR
jgi:hypothetical protein